MNHLRDISTMDDYEMKLALYEARDKLERVSQQISYLDEQISYLRKLFRRAVKNDNYAVRYNLRMQLSISSGVKVMYHHYQTTMETRATDLLVRIRSSSPPPSSSNSGTSDESGDDRTEP